MVIHDLARQADVSPKTIRYYESIGLMPPAERAANNYRIYAPADAERLRFIASARSLGLSLGDIGEILTARDGGEAPCERVLDALDDQVTVLDRRVADLLALRETLVQLRQAGAALPLDDVQGEHCVCYLIKSYRDSGQVIVEREDVPDG